MNDSDRIRVLARALGLRVPDAEIDALAPAVAALYAGLERLQTLPIGDREPAFLPAGRSPGTATS